MPLMINELHASFEEACSDDIKVEKLLAVIDAVLSRLQHVQESASNSLRRSSSEESRKLAKDSQETNTVSNLQRHNSVNPTKSYPPSSVQSPRRLHVAVGKTYPPPKPWATHRDTYEFTSIADASDPILPPSELRGRRVPFGDLNAQRCMTIERSITTFNVDDAIVIDRSHIDSPFISSAYTNRSRSSASQQGKSFGRHHHQHAKFEPVAPSPVSISRNDVPSPFNPASFAAQFQTSTCHCLCCQWPVSDSIYPQQTNNSSFRVMEAIPVPQRTVPVDTTQQRLDGLNYGEMACFCGDPECDAGF